VIQKTEEFFRMLGAKTKLHEFGITEDTPTLVAEKMQSIGLLPCGEHRDMDFETVKEILSLRK
jgi:alcohol dehydrogenase YqhD (iron-dependent ADH family)